MTRRTGLLAASAALALLPALAAQAQEPLSIAKQGYLFAGGKYTTVNGRQVLSGQMYVEYQIPRRRTQKSARRLLEIPGIVPSLRDPIPGCPFAPRCGFATDRCRSDAPPLAERAPGHWAACWHVDRVLAA